MRYWLNKFKKTLRKKGTCFHLFFFVLDYNYSMKSSNRRIILFFSLFLGFSLLYAQGLHGGGAPGGGGPGGGNPPAGQPPAGGKPSDRLPPPPPKDSDNIIKYRGNRTYSENLPLTIIQTRCTRKEGELVCIELLFNQNINPRSVKPDSILINNNPVLPPVRLMFSKKGDSLKMLIPINSNSFKMKVCKIRSFEGTLIEPVEILVEVER